MIRANLLRWQWSDYAAKHQNRANLIIHVVAVPLFQVGTVLLVAGVGIRAMLAIGGALACLALAVWMGGRGHARGRGGPTPFDGALGFARRFVAGPGVTCPPCA